MIKALAVASEPYIFWRGEGVENILSAIDVPLEAGRLLPASNHLNGPSGRSLDKQYLEPLGLTRKDTWLCDLVPHSCMNPRQSLAVKDRYTPVAERFGLPPAKWPRVPKTLADASRRDEIVAELSESRAEILVTLGDLPLKWFTAAIGSLRSLGLYGRDLKSYGRLHDLRIEGRYVKLLPLVHPRQAAGMAGHSPAWRAIHEGWVRKAAHVVI